MCFQSNGDPFRVLEGTSLHRGEFNELEVAFLQVLANTLAVAAQAQQRQDARQQLLREKEALLSANKSFRTIRTC